jgi:AcrR family transcriptional regulator
MNTKERLLSSALTLFSQKGFQATSTTSICANAGFSSGALFVHFKTKNELLDTLYLNIKKEYFLHANA